MFCYYQILILSSLTFEAQTCVPSKNKFPKELLCLSLTFENFYLSGIDIFQNVILLITVFYDGALPDFSFEYRR